MSTDASFLIVDDSDCNIDIIEMYLESEFDCSIYTAKSGNEAIKILTEKSNICCVISDLNMPNGSGAELYQHMLDNNILIPFVLVAGEDLDYVKKIPELSKLFQDESVVPFVGKPFKKKGLINKIKEIKEISVGPEESSYRKIALDRFIQFNKIFIDVLIKVGNKYVKVISKDDENPTDVINKYKERGVKYFYTSPEEFEHFLASSMDLILEQLAKKEICLGTKLELQKHTLENIHDGLVSFGVTKEVIEFTDKVILNSFNSFNQDREIGPILDHILTQQNYLYELGLATSYLGISLGKEMGIEDSQFYEDISMASLLMDIGMENEEMAKITSTQDPNFKKLGISSQELVLKHPERSIEITKDSNLRPEVRTLILSHHERSNGEGFPTKKDAQNLPVSTCTFILAHELSHNLVLKGKDFFEGSQIRKEMGKSFSSGNFKPSFDALLKISGS